MLVENQLVNREDLIRMMLGEFGSESGQLEFIPLGEDSWSYRYGKYWVSVRRDLGGHFPAAYEGAWLLRETGMEFILAPLRGRSGRIVHSVDGFPVVVFPYVDRLTHGGAGGATPAQLELLTRRVAEVHRCELPVGLPVEDFRLPFAEELEKALLTARSGTDVGPMSRDLHRLIGARWDYLEAQRREFAEVAARCARICREGAKHALTHGDPSRANVLLGDDVVILDWGGLMWSPPERDWSALGRHFGVPPRGRAEMLRFYELRWTLAEVAEYTGRFVKPHTGDADDQAMWERLLRYVPAE
ncbi:phosphotransferase [Nocardia sp. NPDC046473]|uniref:phosphotransferase n=1 Tax=Nocardia sp. NPDC046473 TaxID=3155733 RepID=UPI00340060D8